jgi:hypothetical protein
MNDHDYIDGDLTAALHALAAATPGIENTAIEERLLLAFSQHQRARARRIPSMRRWWPAAAILVLTCAGAGFWFGRTPTTSPQPFTSPVLMATTNAVVVPLMAPATRLSVNARTTVPTRPRRADVDSPGGSLEDAIGVLADFIPLPGAAALPDFERGDIVRIEVPLAGLAAYGLDMVPDATPTSVAADLLIGQDGVPRAIRLAPERFQ